MTKARRKVAKSFKYAAYVYGDQDPFTRLCGWYVQYNLNEDQLKSGDLRLSVVLLANQYTRASEHRTVAEHVIPASALLCSGVHNRINSVKIYLLKTVFGS